MDNPKIKWMIWGYPYFRKPPYGLFLREKKTSSRPSLAYERQSFFSAAYLCGVAIAGTSNQICSSLGLNFNISTLSRENPQKWGQTKNPGGSYAIPLSKSFIEQSLHAMWLRAVAPGRRQRPTDERPGLPFLLVKYHYLWASLGWVCLVIGLVKGKIYRFYHGFTITYGGFLEIVL